ncbi:MAG: hypothetical protein ACI3V2_05355 [Faecousia sp.]
MRKQVIHAPSFGFTVEERKTVIPCDAAGGILTPVLQKKSTSAELKEDTIILTKHVVLCPCCGKETPAYQEFLGKAATVASIKSQSFIESWASGQRRLFDEPPAAIRFNVPVDAMEELGEFVCPKCKCLLPRSSGTVEATICAGQKTIKLSRKLNLRDLFLIDWFDGNLSLSSFALYETITFHLKNGHTFVTLEDGRSKPLMIRDISNVNTDHWYKDPIHDLIRNCKPVYRELKRQFIRALHAPLPFAAKDLTLKNYILLTKLVGYDAAFYKTLPFAANGELLERSFLAAARKLHFAKNVPGIVKKAKLPHTKSIQKVMFENPGLLFYTAELERLWKLFDNIDLFRTFLVSHAVFRELLYLHKMPALLDFYREYKAVFGTPSLLKRLTAGSYRWRHYAADYLLLNAYEQKTERKKWLYGFPADEESCCGKTLGGWVSVPIPAPSEKQSALDCTINGFSFKRLENAAEYLQAGEELHNCLTHWEMFDGKVCGIKKAGKYVGAVELDGQRIVQAFTFDNEDIEENEPLFAAFTVWREINALEKEQTFL